MRVRDPYILRDHNFDVSPIESVHMGGANHDAAMFLDNAEFNYLSRPVHMSRLSSHLYCPQDSGKLSDR